MTPECQWCDQAVAWTNAKKAFVHIATGEIQCEAPGWRIVKSYRNYEVDDMFDVRGLVLCHGRIPHSDLIRRGWIFRKGDDVPSFLVPMDDPIWAALP